MDHVTVVDNIFYATDPHVSAYRMQVGLIVGSSARSKRCYSDESVPLCLPASRPTCA